MRTAPCTLQPCGTWRWPWEQCRIQRCQTAEQRKLFGWDAFLGGAQDSAVLAAAASVHRRADELAGVHGRKYSSIRLLVLNPPRWASCHSLQEMRRADTQQDCRQTWTPQGEADPGWQVASRLHGGRGGDNPCPSPTFEARRQPAQQHTRVGAQALQAEGRRAAG